MQAIDYDALTEMCSKIDLLEYASQTFEFRRKGDKYFTSCPHHSDSDPSLCISPDVNLYYCFSCHRSGNIINWMMDYEGLTFQEAIAKASKITGTDLNKFKICDSLKYYKELQRMAESSLNKSIEREILPYSYYDKFARKIPQEWVNEGITAEVMRKYDIRIDESSNRIVYPIYDNDNHLIGVKGRTRFDNFKDLGIKKYRNYTKIQTTNFFVAMKENRQAIEQAGSVIIFEGLKSGLKLASWGLPDTWLAAETSRLNDAQVEILVKMHLREVIIAFDRDVEMKEITKCTAMLKRFCNVYVVRDRYRRNNADRLLPGDKDSPVDAGLQTWQQLLNEKIRL